MWEKTSNYQAQVGRPAPMGDLRLWGYSSIVIDALKSQNISNLSDADIIKLIYAERGKQNEKGELVHFIHSSKKTQKSISNRYKKEMNEALNKLKN